MRILILTYQGGLAGSTFSISYLAKGLARKGHKVYLGYKNKNLLYELLKETNVELIPFPFKHRLDLSSVNLLKKIVKEKKIQIINAQSGIDRYISIIAKKFLNLNAKVIHTRRQRPNSSGRFLHGWFYTWGTDRIIAVSNGVKKRAIDFLRIPADHIKVIYNGTPKKKYQDIMHEENNDLKIKYNIKKNDFVIGCVSRHKQQEQIIKALNYIKKPIIKVIFVGIKKDDLEMGKHDFPDNHKLFFTGRIKPHETLRHYSLFDIHILPSITEGLSQTLLEAMFLEVPVIATNAVGNADLIEHKETGFLFENGDIKQLADQIKELMENTILYEKLLKSAKKKVIKDFSIEKVISNYETFFNDLL